MDFEKIEIKEKKTPQKIIAKEALSQIGEDVDFQQELAINKYKLDEECLSHASRYAYWAEAYSLAKMELMKAKDEMAYVKAQRSVTLRNLYVEAGEKCTEGRLDASVELDPEYRDAKAKVLKANEVAEKLEVAVRSMEVRRAQLDNLVKLYCAGYFSTVSNNPNKKDSVDEVSRDIRKNLNSKENEV